MVDKRFEDSVKVEDLMKKPQKELSVMIYLQAVKTNGQVKDNQHDIECLQDEVKEKIGWKMFTIGASVLGFLIILFNVLNYFAGG